MIFIDVGGEGKTQPWFHDSSSLKISNRKKKKVTPCHGCPSCCLRALGFYVGEAGGQRVL